MNTDNTKDGRFIDLRGKKFGRLTALERFGTKWLCECECGNRKYIEGGHLRSGHTKSCGCYSREVAVISNTTHAQRKHKLYGVWCGMRNRCYNKNLRSYKNYGGRGITVCEEWKTDFKAFLDWALDNGYSEGLSIDRINNNGNYEPTNCRFVNMKKQNNNRSNNHIITYKGKTHTLAEWADITGVPYQTLIKRINKGWSIEDAITIFSVGRFQYRVDVKL